MELSQYMPFEDNDPPTNKAIKGVGGSSILNFVYHIVINK